MCGIVGIAGEQEPDWLTSMNDVQAHRGPDDAGEYRDEAKSVCLAMRRLAILDLEGGHQPMISDNGRFVIVFNGEIFNSPELRRRLESWGYRFSTGNSDTEVLLRYYEHAQEKMLSELNGMFAFVIYDKQRNLLFGARDRTGIKPLYYIHQGKRFAFSSEMKSLLRVPFVEREVDLGSVFHFMTLLHVPTEQSILRGVKRLEPGTWFKFDLSSRKLELSNYWNPDFHRSSNHTTREWQEIIRHELREAVRRWMLSDVPVACSLSGGLDSSTIVGLLGEMGYEGVKTYSLGFKGQEESKWDETNLARIVSERWHTDHREIILEPEALLADLVEMVWALDEPYGGGLPSWYVFKQMGEDVKVGLTGTGGDELFGNYGKFAPFESSPILRTLSSAPAIGAAGKHLPDWAWSSWSSLISAVPEAVLGPNRKQRLSELDKLCQAPFGHHYYANQVYFSDRMKREQVFAPFDSSVLDTASLIQDIFEASAATNARDGMAYVDFKTQLPDEFLSMTDRFSMAHSLEARVPFLDHEFIETIFSIPAWIRTRPDDLKYLLKASVADLLPKEILSSQKRGFVIPITPWIRGPLRPLIERMLSPSRLKEQGIMRPDFFAKFVRPHLEMERDFTWQIWAALMFQIWHVVFIERRSTEKPSFSWKDLT